MSEAMLSAVETCSGLSGRDLRPVLTAPLVTNAHQDRHSRARLAERGPTQVARSNRPV